MDITDRDAFENDEEKIAAARAGAYVNRLLTGSWEQCRMQAEQLLAQRIKEGKLKIQ